MIFCCLPLTQAPFVLSCDEKQEIWKSTEKLLTDSEVEVREHAAGVLAGLLKGGDEDLVSRVEMEAKFAESAERRDSPLYAWIETTIDPLYKILDSMSSGIISDPLV
ncbi:uncharacterized protein LOC113296854 [Papaver somniferum]|uniref:uncharacterized protein LOC113296854 n=1 Tax=Papaver somniferum TaxID=3469 RepID=UPI000E6FE213|nr:uncharacterized protein LOC113296854 [Papaver somniferum]